METNIFSPISLNNYNEKEYASYPYIGWIKPCFIESCRQLTSKTSVIYYKNTYYKIYLCKDCCHHKMRYKFFINTVYPYIDKNYKLIT